MSNGYQGSYGGYQGNYGAKRGNANYTVDMVLCIDATASMEEKAANGQKIIDTVKRNALNFYRDFSATMKEKGKQMAQLRVRIIAFRDFLADGAGALQWSDFFALPEQTEEFEKFIYQYVNAEGGGDIPEDGLEALAFAMKSDWTEKGQKKRRVIVVWTDAGTHELGYGKASRYYPKDMPKNLAELEDMWAAMDEYSKRLVIFAPDTNYWNYISENFKNAWLVASVAGNGMAEQQYSDILNLVANTI